MRSPSRPLDHASEEALRTEEDDQQEYDEDRRVLQLRRQHQGRKLLHEAADTVVKPAISVARRWFTARAVRSARGS